MSLRCIVMSVELVPVDIITSQRALVKYLKGNVSILEEHPGVCICTVNTAYPAPSVVGLRRYVHFPSYHYGVATLTSENLRIRDRHTCQYCGRTAEQLLPTEFWTMDHVFPEARGGSSRWENIVLSCNRCNNKKGDHTPEEVGMPLLHLPQAPSKWSLELLRRM